MHRGYRIPIELRPQPEGGYVVTSPALPELLTEGDTLEEAMDHVNDAFRAVLEIYEDEGRPLPPEILADLSQEPIQTERLVAW